MPHYIISSSCTACGDCVDSCPVNAIVIIKGFALLFERDCIDCGACVNQCPEDAIRFD